MFSNYIRLIFSLLIPLLIIALIVINFFIPSENSSKEEIKKEAERLNYELSVICVNEGHLEEEAIIDCVQDKINILLGD